MEDLRSDLSIFWSESALYVAAYAAYALVACAALAWFEHAQQTSGLSFGKLLGKGLALTAAITVVFTVGLFVSTWRHHGLGEVATAVAVSVLLGVAAWLANRAMGQHLGLEMAWPRLHAWLPALLLAAPFAAFHGFVLLLGSAWRN